MDYVRWSWATDHSIGTCHLRHVAELLDNHGNWKMDFLQQYFQVVDVEEIIKIKAYLSLAMMLLLGH